MFKFIIAAAALLSSTALAAPITGAGTYTLPGMTQTTDFENQPVASFTSLTTGNLKITGIGGVLRTASNYAGDYNTSGTRLLDNNAGGTSGFRFDFTTAVSAFAFNFGASDVNWTLSAYNAAGVLLESLVIAPTYGSNDKAYFGLADAGISYATLTGSSSDWVFVDNFKLAANTTNVPEPGSVALLGAGLAGVLMMRRRKAPNAA